MVVEAVATEEENESGLSSTGGVFSLVFVVLADASMAKDGVEAFSEIEDVDDGLE